VIHYHGTPLTPRFELSKLAGKHFCVSFAAPGDADWCLQNAQSVMWDNGAFSIWKSAAVVDWNKLYAWLEARLGHPHWAVVPDVINGTREQNLDLIKQWPFHKNVSGVVWHLNEGLDHLLRLIDMGFSKVCFGSTEEYDPVGGEAWERLMTFIFNELEKRGLVGVIWLHALRGLWLAGDIYPFSSGDSTNVARNFKNIGRRVCPERMARRIDAVQCPITWAPQPTQQDMFQ
jgi:hypothetical protein